MQNTQPMRRILALAGAATAVLALAGCAGVNNLSSDVASYGEWPADRQPGTYSFERLPSQQALAAEAEQLEAAAAPALAKAGFKVAAAGQQPDVLVQVGSRVQRTVGSRWDDRLWWSGSFGHGPGWRRGGWFGPTFGFGWQSGPMRFDREVGLLIRDRATGRALYETRASNEGFTGTNAEMEAAMFQAALTDFPRLAMNPRRVVVPLQPAP